jgi:dCTP deaminase
MSVITRKYLQQAIAQGEISFEPNLDNFQMQPAAVDLRIGWSFYIPHASRINENGRVQVRADYMDHAQIPENYQLIKLRPGQYFELMPGESIVASTLEKININTGKLMALLNPRSSCSRRGLSIESGVIDPYYNGSLIIPLCNTSNHSIKIYPGERLCQILFLELKEELQKEEASKHGVTNAKYENATPYSLGVRLDPQEEIELLKQGRIDDIKKNFSNNINNQEQKI